MDLMEVFDEHGEMEKLRMVTRSLTRSNQPTLNNSRPVIRCPGWCQWPLHSRRGEWVFLVLPRVPNMWALGALPASDICIDWFICAVGDREGEGWHGMDYSEVFH